MRWQCLMMLNKRQLTVGEWFSLPLFCDECMCMSMYCVRLHIYRLYNIEFFIPSHHIFFLGCYCLSFVVCITQKNIEHRLKTEEKTNSKAMLLYFFVSFFCFIVWQRHMCINNKNRDRLQELLFYLILLLWINIWQLFFGENAANICIDCNILLVSLFFICSLNGLYVWSIDWMI